MATSSPAKDTTGGGNEQVLFLLACIKFSESGRINWEKVAEDRGITSKGAAAKRYERLLKAHGITNPSQRGKDGDSTPQTPKKRGKVVDNGDEEDDEESPTKKTKGRKMSIKKEVKKEEDVNSD